MAWSSAGGSGLKIAREQLSGFVHVARIFEQLGAPQLGAEHGAMDGAVEEVHSQGLEDAS